VVHGLPGRSRIARLARPAKAEVLRLLPARTPVFDR
jgi:hypothetical protein